MEIAITHSRALTGIDSPQVIVEVHLSRGLPSLSIVGLPETAVKESKDRVRSAILNNHLEYPLRRITVNLAPADLPKEGGRYDLPIALGILAASGQILQASLDGYEFIGELALTGRLRPVRGVLAIAKAVRDAGRKLILPQENADEAALIRDLEVLPAAHLMEVCAHLNGAAQLSPHQLDNLQGDSALGGPDLIDIRGQHHAKRALEITAAGGHNMLLVGPPGTGKTMLAERLPGILPPMTEEQALESAAVISISRHHFHVKEWKKRPIRAPHHTASGIALVGGGSYPRPGEISLAHHGVLFLDEFPEFDRKVLEVLREPLESGRITISRAAQQAEFPADFQLIAAMNPCHCGYLGDDSNRCRCTPEQVRRYRAKLSGPLLDRIDIHIEVPNLPKEILRGTQAGTAEASEVVRERVIAAYQLQLDRAGKPNSKLNNCDIERFCQLDDAQTKLLEQAIERFGFSARAMHRILKVARTMADLAGCEAIATEHLAEAITYRRLERIDLDE